MDTSLEQTSTLPEADLPPETAKDAYERRQREKREARGAGAVGGGARRSPGGAKLFRLFLWLVVAGAIVYGVYTVVRKNTPQGEDLSRAIPVQGQEHIDVGAEHEPYNSNPPTSGPHYATPARPGFRDEVIADEHLVHSLEHGLVWISYHPRVAPDVVDSLRDFAGQWVVVTAREQNEHDIALAAWGRLDAFHLEGGALGEAASQRIRDFINRYRGRGPERIPAGQHGGI